MAKQIKYLGGITMFNWYGNGNTENVYHKPLYFEGTKIFETGGKQVSTLEACKGFKLQRSFNGVFILTKPEGAGVEQYSALRTEPTDQKFFFDTFLAAQKAYGIKHSFGTQGTFDWYDTVGKQGKVYPLMKDANPMDAASWADYAEICRQIAIRYADDTGHLLSQANVYDGTWGANWGGMLTNTPKAGLGLIDTLEGWNEYDFNADWMDALWTMTPEQAGVGAAEMYKAVRSVSKTLKISLPSGIHNNIAKVRRLIVSYLAHGGGTDNVVVDTHNYNNKNGRGATPFEDNTFEFETELEAICVEFGFPYWKIGERGWNSLNEGTKQDVPPLEGFNLEQAVGIMMVQDTCLSGNFAKCDGVTYWHCRMGYDRAQYRDGLNDMSWNSKDGNIVYSNFIESHGDKHIITGSYKTDNTLFTVELEEGGFLVWTNRDKVGDYDAMPIFSVTNPIAAPVPPPNPNPVARVTSVELVKTPNGELVADLLSTTVIEPNEEPMTIVVTLEDGKSVRMELSGGITKNQLEGVVPYAQFGDTNGSLRGQLFPEGNYTFTATPYSSWGGSGNVGTILGIQFSISATPPQQEPQPLAGGELLADGATVILEDKQGRKVKIEGQPIN